MADRSALNIARPVLRVFNRPAVMELTQETVEGFMRFAIEQGDPSYFDDILKSLTVRFPWPRPSYTTQSYLEDVLKSLKLRFSLLDYLTPTHPSLRIS
jgi:hypothetical protein